jgi:predicted RNA-binding protein with RPS1 domain
MLEKGQEIEVKILSIDPQNEKISVGLKQLERDPWEAVIESTPIGSHVEVEIAKLVSFGAFARLENGIEGLIHVSEISTDRVQKPEDVLTVGDRVKAKVIGIDPIERKIALSIREYQRDLDARAQAEYAQTKEQPVSVGDVVGDALPRSMLQAGRSLADAANEMMAAVSAQFTSARAAQEQAAETQEPPAPQPSESASEDKAGQEPPASGGDN